MPTLNDIKDSAVSRFDAVPAQVLNSLNVLPQLDSPERAFRFALQQFGLERLPVNRFRAGTSLNAVEAEGFEAGASKDITTMHTGAYGEPPMSGLGTPIFCDMIVNAPADRLNATSTSVQLLNVIVVVDQQKNIVKTTVQGFDGTVKEYISDGDYSVSIRGVLYNTFRKDYPRDNAQLLLKIFKRKQALDVTSEYLRLFDIHSLVVESFKMGQEMGRQNMQKFEVTCSSDLPLLLKKRAR
jgi:hypothetical protein